MKFEGALGKMTGAGNPWLPLKSKINIRFEKFKYNVLIIYSILS